MTHPIIKTDNYILITSDEEIKLQDWGILFDSVGNILYGIPLQYTDSKNQHINKYFRKIIAHLPLNNSPILEGVPLLPPLSNEENDLASQEYPFLFIEGYKKAKEKYKFTEEDVIKIVEKSRETGLTAEFLMLSLSQPKLPVGFKCEMELNPVNHAAGLKLTGNLIMDISITQNYTPKIINGVMQGEWIFE